MLAYIYTGETEYINNCKAILIDLIELSNINDEPHMWWVFRLLYLLFDEYETASLWSVLPNVISDSEDRKKYINANIYKKIPVVELFKSQRECIQQSERYTGGFIVGMPTSSGKTKVAEISLVKTLSQYPEALCIYLAPFRSLANEIELSLSSALGAIGYTVSHLYGSTQATQLDRRTVSEANVIIATPEKIKSILRANTDLENRIKLVIVDEGHLVGGQARYITSELLIEELKSILVKTDGKLILLSAVLPNLSDFSMWVSGKEDCIAQSTWRPSAQRFGELSFSNNSVNLNWRGVPPSFNNRFVDSELIKRARTTNTGKSYPAKYFPHDKKDAVGATAVKMLSMGSVLIYVGRSNMVLSQARVVADLFNKKKITHQWKNLNNLKYVELTCAEAYGEESDFYSFIKQGIICHSSKLPVDVRQSVERLMANESPKIVIATSTLGQGVNLGVSTVIISNVYLNESDVVDVKDFWNIAGRAGRAFTDTEGKILFAVDRSKSNYSIDTQNGLMERYFQYNNIEKASSGLYLLLRELLRIANDCRINYEILLELLAENCDIVEVANREQYYERTQWLLNLLDDSLLAMSIKHSANEALDCSEWIEKAFSSSLAFVQSIDSVDFNQIQVINLLKARNKGVIKLAGAPARWKALISSSIPLKASLYIDEQVDALVDIVRNYVDSRQTFEELMELIKHLDEFVALLPLTFDSELVNVLSQFPIRDAWYGGEPIEKILSIAGKADVICTQYYNFHFPWVINALSKKILLLGKTEEAKILEDISLFSEIGVSDIISAQIYLAGIKSRICAIELSKFVDEKAIAGISIKKQLFELIGKFDDGEIIFSDKAYQWLTLIDIDNKKSEWCKLPFMKIRVDYEQVPLYEKLYCKLHKNKIYLCSWDYKIKLLVREEFQEKYRTLVGHLGVYFKMAENNEWELISENPYISILQD